MFDFLDEEIDKSPTLQKKVAEESLILDAVELVWKHMEKKDISIKQLAELLETSQANVSLTLSGSHNMTLRTFAAIMYVLGKNVRLSVSDR